MTTKNKRGLRRGQQSSFSSKSSSSSSSDAESGSSSGSASGSDSGSDSGSSTSSSGSSSNDNSTSSTSSAGDDSSTSSSSEDSSSFEEEGEATLQAKIKRICAGAECLEHSSILLDNKHIADLDDLYRVKAKHLKALGVDGENDCQKLAWAIKQDKLSTQKSKLNDRKETELDVIYKILRKHDLKRFYGDLKAHSINSLKKAQSLDHKQLRSLGVEEFRDRRNVLHAFEDYNGEYLTSSSSESVSASTGTSSEDSTSNVVQETLEHCGLIKYYPVFEKLSILSIRQARGLSHTQLRSMGIKYYLEREKLIEGFEQAKPRNKSILRILKKTSLQRYSEAFASLCDVDEARELTHKDLRTMGISLHGQRDRLMNEFRKYVPHKERIMEKKRFRRKLRMDQSYKVPRAHKRYNEVEEVLLAQGLKQVLRDFDSVKTLKQARRITHDELQSKGIGLEGVRTRLIEAFDLAYKNKRERFD